MNHNTERPGERRPPVRGRHSEEAADEEIKEKRITQVRETARGGRAGREE